MRTALVSLMVLGCATNSPESAREARRWRAQLERQQQVAREAGRIGLDGNEGPLGDPRRLQAK